MFLQGASLVRSGPAWRRIQSLAQRHDVEIPPAEHHDAVMQVVDGFNRQYLQMGLAPQDFVSVTLAPTQESFAPGEPVLLEAVLTNTGDVPLPLGQWGLLNPVMRLEEVRVPGREEPFDNLPVIVWPAPRYLQPGQSVRWRVPIDVGELEEYLAQHPLESLSLAVTATLDPTDPADDTAASGIPEIEVAPITVMRSGLLPAGAPGEAVDAMFSDVRRRLASADVRERVLAGTQAGMLMVCVSRSEAGDLPPGFDAAEVRALLTIAMGDSSSLVRAATLQVLVYADLDVQTIPLLAVCIVAPEPLVRFRVLEALAVPNTPDCLAVVNYLANDANPYVRILAATFQRRLQQ